MLSRCTRLPSRYASRALRTPAWATLPARHASRSTRPKFTPEQAHEKYEMRIEVLKSQREKARIQAQNDGDLAAQAQVYSDYAAKKVEAQNTLAQDLREAHGEIEPTHRPGNGPNDQGGPPQRNIYTYKVLFRAFTAFIIIQIGIEILVPEKYKPRNWYKTWTTHDVDAFQTFEIVSRTDVSSTASLFTLKPAKSTLFWTACKEAQQKGVWNVQFKQPQIQVVRAYTPLPNLNAEERNLAFLIRHETGGEVSNWLRRLPMGSSIEIRGPFVEFEIPEETDRVVFLAGGTGIAPALQAAESFLSQPPSPSNDAARPGNGKTVHILWSCRRREDCVGGMNDTGSAVQTLPAANSTNSSDPDSWLNLSAWWKPTPVSPTTQRARPVKSPNQIISRLTKLQARFPDQISITYFVDEENTFITTNALQHVLSTNSAASTTTTAQTINASPLFPPSKRAPSPSPSAQSPPQTSIPPPPNSSQPSSPQHHPKEKIQILISGPDGFVAALAGPKIWTQTGEEQGALGGMLAKVLAEQAEEGQAQKWGNVSVYKI